MQRLSSQCLILAGGLGTRMKAISGDLPKALLPLGPQTFIDWQLQWLKRQGADEVVMALGYGGEEIRKHVDARLSTGLYPRMKYRFDGTGPAGLQGTGGAVRNCADLLEDDFAVTYGDSFLFVRVSELFEAHRKGGRGVTFSIFRNEGRGDTSNVAYRDGRVVYDKFNLTPDMEYIDYGMMVLSKKYFLSKAPEGKFDLAPFLTQACRESQVTPFVARESFREIGSPEGYRGLCELMAAHGFDLSRLEALIP